MEKILLAINAIKPDTNSLDFACYLGRLTNSKITGIFLENIIDEEALFVTPVSGVGYISDDVRGTEELQRNRREAIENNILYYKEACNKRAVGFVFHHDRGIPASKLIEESRYADIMIVDANTSFNKHSEGAPTDFIKDILANTECPVIVAPEDFTNIEEVVFTYDDSASSVFAIKQFTYLFPELRNKKATIIHINHSGEWNDVNTFKLKELLKNYYFDLHFELLKGNIYNSLFDYVSERKNTFLVMGAYGRNALSRFFKPSRADIIIRNVVQPIFIAHF